MVGEKLHASCKRERWKDTHMGLSCIKGATKNLGELCLERETDSPEYPVEARRTVVFIAIFSFVCVFSLEEKKQLGVGMPVYMLWGLDL